jgi:uncharacterized membrane protein
MTQEDPYDLKPVEKKEEAPRPKPGEPGWVEPVPVVEKAEAEEPVMEADPDVEKHKGVAVLGYVLFLIPLVAAPRSPFARFHANQGLLVFILWFVAFVGVVVLSGVHLITDKVGVPILTGFFFCLTPLLQGAFLLGVLVLTIMGIIHAANGEKKALPLVGQWTLIK